MAISATRFTSHVRRLHLLFPPWHRLVRHLFDQLTARNREPWADWQDIPPTADWLAEIYRGIEAADSFLFIIRPDSVASEICTLEIEHVVKHNKRLIPVVWKDVDTIHPSMSARNWVFLRSKDDFEVNFELLIEALSTDLSYVREHTRLLTRAIEWDENNRRRSNILLGPELITAEGWRSISPLMEPQSTDLYDVYMTFSRAAVNRLQRFIYTSIGLAFVIMLGLSIFSCLQSDLAKNERLEREKLEALKEVQLIKRTARISQAKSLAAFALLQLDKDPELSLILSLEAVKVARNADSIAKPR